MSYKDDILAVSTLNIPWEKLDGCNILITGASGLIGGCLVDVLMSRPNRKYSVYASARNEEIVRLRFIEHMNDPSFHFIKYDVTYPLSSEVCFQYIIHAASNASPIFFASKPVEVIKSNVYGVSNLIDYGITHDLKRFLFISSGEVYGEGDGRVFTEDYSGYVDPMSPRSCYPSSKRTAETLCVSYGVEYGIDTVIARPSHTYGPYFTESDNRVYAQFIRNILADEDIIMKSLGDQFRSWCYVVDCASAILYILLKGESGQAYNIADESSNISIKDLANIIANIDGKKVIIKAPTELEKSGFNKVTKAVFSTEKLFGLGWRACTNIQDGLLKTVNELKACIWKNNQPTCYK